ncbi:hypothetical protein CPB83DRAFT_840854 [Crepidotus variabilis]|uniref:Uncharacterized protein n=1 Tax=Crepidotus variabilis TaxID=179855 RepID=A0A9P6E3Q8_9AGAR|nr:hypothetical protein CPB83DRAFT_840854 [Crepidotus variabilis]
MNAFLPGTRVFFWSYSGEVEYGIIQGTKRLPDGTTLLIMKIEGKDLTATLPRQGRVEHQLLDLQAKRFKLRSRKVLSPQSSCSLALSLLLRVKTLTASVDVSIPSGSWRTEKQTYKALRVETSAPTLESPGGGPCMDVLLANNGAKFYRDEGIDMEDEDEDKVGFGVLVQADAHTVTVTNKETDRVERQYLTVGRFFPRSTLATKLPTSLALLLPQDSTYDFALDETDAKEEGVDYALNRCLEIISERGINPDIILKHRGEHWAALLWYFDQLFSRWDA